MKDSKYPIGKVITPEPDATAGEQILVINENDLFSLNHHFSLEGELAKSKNVIINGFTGPLFTLCVRTEGPFRGHGIYLPDRTESGVPVKWVVVKSAGNNILQLVPIRDRKIC